MKVAFLTDTGTGVSVETWKQRGVYCVPLQIEYDGSSYEEMETITYNQFIQNLHLEKDMKTSLPSLGRIEDCFDDMIQNGFDTVFAVPICRGLSSTLDTMAMIARQKEMDFIGIDCFVTAVVQEKMILKAKALYEQGVDLKEIESRVQKMADGCETILLCDDLQHMSRGGRLTPMAATLGGLLKIKPILKIDQSTSGKVDVMDKVRTMKKAQDKVIEMLKQKGVDASFTFVVAHVDALDGAKEYAQKIRAAFEGAEVSIIPLVSVVGIHTGLGCLALQVFQENV